MSVTEPLKKGSLPQIVKLDKALKLAEVWINNMSKVEDDEPTDADKEGRPPRLGLGAKVFRQSKVGPSDDPVERKLYAKLDARKRKAAQMEEESRSSQRDGVEDDEDDAGEDSRTSSFIKKAAPRPLPSTILGNKKRK
ncbi:uncharacterized protein LOC129290476 [Prosopis cineraria]|uniref:uncharacterized protein LOC129290476 n=1 Tax=Prosopis cineraria TaxID=364024 RepID=UPI00240FC4B7|nr:uncharacterized protein LOC129290476 [Prosopis cineraria]XP_054783233.1 uncharacterized protein LOC129290476 [Prosopis cineraria]XP_054783234.1 uncharacterized protein LOC129290476 [Prosopis cineraria]XP_054783235.1 uncharacterized protein LOC129290476 [Prosopis cineraria]XP_054783236.1 uncharacterized protein LOC129290476 [Prosopis cineraria]XP_054783237.1 uncharacterized protein LOC129290476 [Prosopis cineraria]XP_054783238.1 uncharacterized protein LOC129290476 [Prosopis cineraria]